MREEIFGPILPILEYDSLEEAMRQVNSKSKPLALYLFTESQAVQDRVLREIPFGGGCMNDVIYHLVNPHLPFGGVGESGMGAYHGAPALICSAIRKAYSSRRPVLTSNSVTRIIKMR